MRTMTIRGSIVATLAIAIAVLVISASLALRATNRQQEHVATSLTEIRVGGGLGHGLENAVRAAAERGARFVESGRRADSSAFEEAVAVADSIRRALLTPGLFDTEVLNASYAVGELHSRLQVAVWLSRASERDGDQAIGRWARLELAAVKVELPDVVAHLDAAITARALQREADLAAVLDASSAHVRSAIGFAAFAIVLLGLVLQRSVMRPLAAIVADVESLGNGVLVAPEHTAVRLPRDHEYSRVRQSVREARARLRLLVDEVTRSERLSATGALVSGIAHELNNPLHAILLMSEDLLNDVQDPSMREGLELIMAESNRTRAIVRNLQAFAQSPGAASAGPVDLRPVIERVASEVRAQVEANGATLDLDKSIASAASVHGSQEAVEQILANLLINAAQAAGRGGRVEVSMRPGRRPAIEVRDDGPGIPREIMGRVFEPFFTTRPVGQGTGLGLSVALGLAKSMGCTLELRNRAPHRGACAVLSWDVATT